VKVRFCFVNSLSGEDEYIVKNLIADLKEALNIDIKKIEDQSSKQQLPKIDLVITDDYQTANLVANEEGKVIYWFRNPSDNFNISNQKLKFPVVVSSRSLGNHLPKELRGEAKIIYPGVMQKVYKPVAVDDMIETTKRRILILGQELNSKKIEHLVKSLELINQGCQMKISIIRKEGFKIETNIEYEFINPNSLEAKVVEYSKAELAIVVAENEGFRLRPLEIMACKTPIIFIHNKGVKEYISHNHNCRLLLYPEPKRLAITALKLLKNNILAKNIAIKGSTTAKEYSWNKTVLEWGQLICKELGIPETVLIQEAELESEVNDELPAPSSEWEEVERRFDAEQSTRLDISEQLESLNYDEDYVEDRVDIVIINYNTKEEIKDCLESIKELTDYNYQVIVVDNNSTDGSIEYLESLDWIDLIKNDDNLGYARACNQGIKKGNSEYILLLNSDIRVTEGWLKPLVEMASSDDEIAVVGPKLINEAGEIVGAGVTELDETCSPRGWKEEDSDGKYDEVEECVSVGGAAYLIKRELIPEIGLFDERYFFYFEETDYSLRVREKGYKVIYCPKSKIYHLHEGSLKEGDEVGRKKRNKYFSESQELFLNKWDHLILAESKPKRSILALGIIPWSFRHQRPQQILSRLSEGCKVLYVNNFKLGQGWFEPENSLEIEKIDSNLYVLSPPSDAFVYELVQSEAGCKLLAQVINDSLDRLNMREPILWLDSPYWEPVIKYLSPAKVIYNCMDKFEEFDGLSEKAGLIKRFERDILSIADIVMVTSQVLLDKVKYYNENVHLVPNAAEIDHFKQAYEEELEVPIELEEIDGPIVGFFGAIAEWFDVELVANLAMQEPDISIVLIGNVTIELEELEGYENVYLLGEKPYQQLPNYLQGFDVCIIPFIKNDLTLSTDPVKLYEYLAANKPVVSIDLPEVRKFAGVIEIADNKEDFCEKVSKLCKEDKDKINREEIQKLLSKNDWTDRVKQIKDLIGGFDDVEVIEESKSERGLNDEELKTDENLIDITEVEEVDKNKDSNKAISIDTEETIQSEPTNSEVKNGEAISDKEEVQEEKLGFFKRAWSKVKNKFDQLIDWIKELSNFEE